MAYWEDDLVIRRCRHRQRPALAGEAQINSTLQLLSIEEEQDAEENHEERPNFAEQGAAFGVGIGQALCESGTRADPRKQQVLMFHVLHGLHGVRTVHPSMMVEQEQEGAA